jgi:hypothetical protein
MPCKQITIVIVPAIHAAARALNGNAWHSTTSEAATSDDATQNIVRKHIGCLLQQNSMRLQQHAVGLSDLSCHR